MADNPAFQWWRAPATIQPHSAWGRAGDPAVFARDAAVMRELDVRIFRFEVPWRELQPLGRGHYSWQRLERILEALDRHAIEPLPVVVYTPPWAMDQAARTGAGAPYDRGLFADLMATLAERYRGRCRHWELWNEPDHPHSWSGTLGEYVRLILQPGSQAIRVANSDARVVLGGLAHHANLRALHAEGGADWYDIASIHHYPRRASARSVDRAVRSTRAVLRRTGATKPLWLTECGIASREPSLASSFGAFTDEAGQAGFVQRLIKSVPADAIFYYQLRDTVIFDGDGRRIKEVFWGLTDETGNRKPAYYAFAGGDVSPGRRPPGSAARTELAHPGDR